MTDRVCITNEGDLAVLTLNEPDRRNPTSIGLLDDMDAAFDSIESARVLILAGAGRAFCAGLDLDEVRGGADTVHRLLTRLGEVMRRVRRLPCVTIAAVQGAAIGGGFGFLAASDIVVSHPEAKIGYPPPRLGLSPALMAPWLFRRIGPSRARAMLLRGGTISGEEAHRRGIVDELVERDEIDTTARAIAADILTAPAHALLAMKSMLNDIDGSLDDAILDRAAETSAQVIAHEATQKRMKDV